MSSTDQTTIDFEGRAEHLNRVLASCPGLTFNERLALSAAVKQAARYAQRGPESREYALTADLLVEALRGDA